ncbi:MAG: glutaredoxin family protein [Phycisphaerae bacterium]|nr:glutaredoxin family protein [Phycisphaerae bacterium]
MKSKTIDVVIYTRPSCQRTQSARILLNDARRRFPIEIREYDVTLDVTLEIAYGIDTPVILIDGIERFRREVNEHELNIILQTVQMKRRQLRRRERET